MKIFPLALLAAIALQAMGETVDLKGIFPSSVKCVTIVAPSSHIGAESVAAVTNGLGQAGYKVKVADSVWTYSADPAVRARDIEKAWLDPETDLVLCARGGRGGWDTVTNLNFSVLKSRNVPFVGFSNISTLMNAFIAQGVHHPITGPMCSTLSRGKYPRDARERLCQTVAGEPLAATQLKVLRASPTTVTGKPVGGHWPSISRMEAPYLPDTTGRVAFLEINRTYTFDTATNTFAVLKRKGYFKSLSAAVLCDFGIRGTAEEKEKLRKHVVGELTCPVFSGYPYGHIGRIYAIDYERELAISPSGLLTWK
ncbi:MAG: LD-carboxypeptidase [Kiritimatiellae bacterium]|nr:LD-carboxypeptidase [Kiritimatiellia bacterium]